MRQALERFRINCDLVQLETRIQRRFDRCCHPGKPDDAFLWLARVLDRKGPA